MSRNFKIALCQMAVTSDKEQNQRRAAEIVEEAVRGGGSIVCLPELWNSPYEVKRFAEYAETAEGPSASLMSGLACKHGIYLIGGSIPERATGPDGKDLVYNTSFVFDPSGALIARHRKINLFDINIERVLDFKESNFFAAGKDITVFDTGFGKMGLAICFDLRFPEMFWEMAKEGALLVFLPAAFNMNTGSAHWDTLVRSRALDNQFYLAACAPARNLSASFISWSHSCVATPWGEYCAAADSRETTIHAQIDMDYLQKIRRELPIGYQ